MHGSIYDVCIISLFPNFNDEVSCQEMKFCVADCCIKPNKKSNLKGYSFGVKYTFIIGVKL